MNTKTLKVIYGPTAIGKTKLAIKLAKLHNTEVISADSRQFYKEMSIGTAIPSKDELNQVRHHFIHHKSIHENFNVNHFEQEGLNLTNSLFEKYDTLILVGGSGLYIDALCKGLDKFPEIDDNLRDNTRLEYQKNGLKWLQDEVKKLDIKFYQKADVNNPQRLLRCLEVCRQSGQSYSSFRINKSSQRLFDVDYISIKMDRDKLYNRINKRVDIMMENGLLKEAENLYPYQNLNALQTVGYKELFMFMDNKIKLEKAIDLIKQNSRRYAKRQITWLKRYPIQWF